MPNNPTNPKSVSHPCPSEPALSVAEGDQPAPNQRQSAAIPVRSPISDRPSPRRGGRRPGAGAPRGNLNALKHGRCSRQFAEIGALVASSPEARALLLTLSRRHQQRELRADEAAADVFARLFKHAAEVARGEASPGPFQHLGLNADGKPSIDAHSKKIRTERAEALAALARDLREIDRESAEWEKEFRDLRANNQTYP